MCHGRNFGRACRILISPARCDVAAQNIVTLYDLNWEVVDKINIPLNHLMQPGAILVHLGRKFARGGGPNSFYEADEYGELMEETKE